MKNVLRFAVFAFVLAGCAEEPLGYEYVDQFSLSMWQGDAEGVYFLPPLLEPSYAGTFDPGRNPVVVVCAGAASTPCTAPAAVFDMVLDEGETEARVVRVSLLDEHYSVNWKAADEAQGLYRIFVLENGVTQAYIDVALTRGGASITKARRIREYGAEAAREFNGTLPIAFRMEERETPAPATGLLAQYYDWSATTPDFALATPLLERLDPVVNFSDPVGDGDVLALGRSDHVMARWSGSVVITETGFYTFCLRTDNGKRLFINNFLFFEDWAAGPETERCASYWASQAGPVPIRIEWFHATGATSAQLFWQNTGSIERQIIPTSALSPS
ncbi:MAG TPA: PA14 domain-containing protein [Longimicrobiales bacterium]|nr:PA14 domain-containing protein [Longimicrobiales bacterium]